MQHGVFLVQHVNQPLCHPNPPLSPFTQQRCGPSSLGLARTATAPEPSTALPCSSRAPGGPSLHRLTTRHRSTRTKGRPSRSPCRAEPHIRSWPRRISKWTRVADGAVHPSQGTAEGQHGVSHLSGHLVDHEIVDVADFLLGGAVPLVPSSLLAVTTFASSGVKGTP